MKNFSRRLILLTAALSLALNGAAYPLSPNSLFDGITVLNEEPAPAFRTHASGVYRYWQYLAKAREKAVKALAGEPQSEGRSMPAEGGKNFIAVTLQGLEVTLEKSLEIDRRAAREVIRPAFESGRALAMGPGQKPLAEQTQDAALASRVEAAYQVLIQTARQAWGQGLDPGDDWADRFESRRIVFLVGDDNPSLLSEGHFHLIGSSGRQGRKRSEEAGSHYIKLALVELAREVLGEKDAMRFFRAWTHHEAAILDRGPRAEVYRWDDAKFLDEGFKKIWAHFSRVPPGQAPSEERILDAGAKDQILIDLSDAASTEELLGWLKARWEKLLDEELRQAGPAGRRRIAYDPTRPDPGHALAEKPMGIFQVKLDERRAKKEVPIATDELGNFHFGLLDPELDLAKLVFYPAASLQGSASGRYRIIANRYPMMPSHLMIISEEVRPQMLDVTDLAMAMRLAETGSWRISFNSWGAQASVNHFHFHLFPFTFPIENLKIEEIASLGVVKLSRAADYPASHAIFEGGSVEERAKALARFIAVLARKKLPYNLLFSGGRAFVFIRSADPEGRTAGIFGGNESGYPEMAGYITAYTRDSFDRLTEPLIRSALAKATLSEAALQALLEEFVGRPPVQKSAKPPTILVVDDEEILRTVIAEGLKTAGGYEAVTAASRDEALEVLQKLGAGGVDLVLTDRNMPALNEGLKLAEAIGGKIPVVLMSGTLDKDGRTAIEPLLENGRIRKVLEKPFDLRRLSNLIKEMLLSKSPSKIDPPAAVRTALEAQLPGAAQLPTNL